MEKRRRKRGVGREEMRDCGRMKGGGAVVVGKRETQAEGVRLEKKGEGRYGGLLWRCYGDGVVVAVVEDK